MPSRSESPDMNVLVTDPIADAGLDRLREAGSHDVETAYDVEGEALLDAVADANALIVRSGTRSHRGGAGRGAGPRHRRPGRHRRRQHRHRRRHRPRRHRRQRAGGQRPRRRGALRRDGLCHRPLYPAGPSPPERGRVGQGRLPRHRGQQQDPGRRRLRPRRPGGRQAPRQPRDGYRHLRPLH